MADSTFLVEPSTGETYEVRNPEKAKALLQSGWQPEGEQGMIDRVARDTVRDMPVMGRLAAGAGQFTNQLLLGVPQLIYENTGSEEDKQRKRATTKALAEEYPVTNIAGGAAGLAVALLGPGELAYAGKTAAALGDAGVQAVTRAAAAAGPKAAALISNKLAQTAVKAGVENVAFNLPYRVTEEMLGDPNVASEGLLAAASKDFALGAGVVGGIGLGTSIIPGAIRSTAKLAKGANPKWFQEQANKFQIKQAGLLTSDIRKLEDYTHKLTFPEQIQSFVDDLNTIVPEGQWRGPEFTAQAVQEARKATGQELTRIRSIVDKGAGESIPFSAVDEALQGVKAKYSTGSVNVAAEQGVFPSEITADAYQTALKTYGPDPTKWPAESIGGTPGSPSLTLADPTRTPDLKAIKYVDDAFRSAAARKMEAAGMAPEDIAAAFETGDGLPKFGLSELHDLRQSVKEKLYKEERVAGILTDGGNDAFKAVGSVMDDAINDYAAQSGNQQLIDAFGEANARYHKIKQMLKIVEPAAERAIARNKIGLGSTIWTGGGYIAGGQVGALAGLAAGYVKQHYGNLIGQKLMGFAAKTLETIPSDLGKAVTDMLSPTVTKSSKAATLGTVGLFSRYAGNDKGDEAEAVKGFIQDLNYASSAQDKQGEVLDALTGGLSNIAPQNFALMGMGLKRATDYLQQESPKPPPPIYPGGPVPTWNIGANDVSKYARKVNAVFNPLAIIDEIRAGVLTRESVDAVKAVYPNLYAKIQSELARRLAAAPAAEVMKIRRKLSLILEDGLDPQVRAQRIQSLQAGHAPNESKQNPKANSKIDEAGRTKTSLGRALE